MTKRILIPLLKVLVSVTLVIIILSRIGIARFRHSLAIADFTWILIAVLTFSASNILGALQWNVLLRARGIRFSLFQTLSFYYVGLFMNNFLVGYIGGDAFRAYDASRLSGHSSAAISSVFLDRIIGFTVLTSLALIVSLLWHGLIASSSTLFVVIPLLAAWCIAFLFFFNKKFAQKFLWIFDILLPKSFHPKLKQIYQNMYAYRSNSTMLVAVVALSALIQFLRILVHYIAALAVGVHIALIYFVVFVPIIALAASLPISIGGIGVREQSGILLFAALATSTTSIVAMEFLAYLIGVISTIPGGVIFLLRKEHATIQEIRSLEAG